MICKGSGEKEGRGRGSVVGGVEGISLGEGKRKEEGGKERGRGR